MGGLHLDGIKAMSDCLKTYGYEFRNEGEDDLDQKYDVFAPESLKSRVLTTFTMPLHAILITVNTLVLQLIRGVVSIAVGLLTLNGRKIFSGLNDLFSTLIQAIALPILGLVASPATRFAAKVCHSVRSKWDAERSPQGLLKEPPHPLKCVRPVVERAEGVIRGLTALPICLTSGVSKLSIGIFAGRWFVCKAGGKNLLMGVVTPFFAILAPVSKPINDAAFLAHQIMVDSPQKVPQGHRRPKLHN